MRGGGDIVVGAAALGALGRDLATRSSRSACRRCARRGAARLRHRGGAIWNRMLSLRPSTRPIADRRFAAASGRAAGVASSPSLPAECPHADRAGREPRWRREDPARIRFAVLQWIDAASPSNYLALNPEAQKKAIETAGESLVHGVQPALERRPARPRLADRRERFEVGRNVATTAGSVVFENELFQLLEYAPLTAKVHERPMLFVPPCINKFYILDLQPENSLIRYTVERGPSRLRHQLEERRRRDRPAHLGRLHRARGDRGDRPGAGDHRPEGNQHAGLLHRRHAPRDRAGGAGGARRATGRQHDAADLVPRLQRHRHPRHLHRRAGGPPARDDARRREPRRRQPAQGPGAGDDLQLPAAERPGLELRRRRLPEGRVAAAVRPALLERRRHQPARADVLLVPAQHLPREQPRQGGQGDGVRRADRSRQHRSAELPLRLARRPHRALARRLPEHAGAEGQVAASCSAPRATSPA